MSQRTICCIVWSIVLSMSSVVVALTPQEQQEQRELRRVRSEAVNSIAANAPCTFITQKHLIALMERIQKHMSPKMHQKLLEIDAALTELAAQKQSMLDMGLAKNHPALQWVDRQMRMAEKEIDGLLHYGGLVNWKTIFALGFGLAVGMGIGKYKYKKMTQPATSESEAAGSQPGTPQPPSPPVQLAWHKQPKGASITKGLLIGVGVAMALEFVLRGRRSLLAGNIGTGVQKLFGWIGTFLKNMFCSTGWLDTGVAKTESLLRGSGKSLDSVFDNKTAVGCIAAASVIVAVAIYAAIR